MSVSRFLKWTNSTKSCKSWQWSKCFYAIYLSVNLVLPLIKNCFGNYLMKRPFSQYWYYWTDSLVVIKSTVMQIEKALINDRLCVSAISKKSCIPTAISKKFCITVFDFAVISPWNLLFSWKIAFILLVSIAFYVYKQNFTAQKLKN